LVIFVVSGVEFKQLRQDLKVTNASAFAVGTSRNLKVQWESFLLFCFYFNLSYLPASTLTIQLFAQFLSRSFKSVDSIKNYISGVRTMHLLVGFEVEHLNAYLINLSLKGLSRLNPHAVKRAEPITLSILFKIFDCLDFSCSDNIVYWCLFLFAFFLVARKSNLVPTYKEDIVKGRYLRLTDIEEFDDYLLVKFNWSKTIQFGERQLCCPLIRFKDSRICPVSAYKRLLNLNIKNEFGAVFASINGDIITYYRFQSKLRKCIKDIGLNSQDFSTHSFRRGFATLAFHNNVPPEHIQFMGDWKSDAYKCYLQLSWTDKMDILRNMFHEFL
jgi:integrase